MKVKVLIHEAEEGGYWAEVPALPGCFSEGETMEEMLANIREAVEAILATGPRGGKVPPGAVVREVEV